MALRSKLFEDYRREILITVMMRLIILYRISRMKIKILSKLAVFGMIQEFGNLKERIN